MNPTIDLDVLRQALGDLALQNVILQSQQKTLQIDLAKAQADVNAARADAAKAA